MTWEQLRAIRRRGERPQGEIVLVVSECKTPADMVRLAAPLDDAHARWLIGLPVIITCHEQTIARAIRVVDLCLRWGAERIEVFCAPKQWALIGQTSPRIQCGVPAWD